MGLGVRNRDTADFGIVTDQSTTVPRQADVKLKPIAAMFDSQVEGDKSVLGNGARHTRAPMSQE